MPYCGRRAFTTSPVRWALISTRSSSTNCAKDSAPSISPSMLMPTRADNKPPNYWPIVLTLKAFFLLLRHTGMRIGECVDLSYDCLRSTGPNQWTIHVPLGKAYASHCTDRKSVV